MRLRHVREALGEQLAAVVPKIIGNYRRFVEAGPGAGPHEEPKVFGAHHVAARTALAHLDQLTKMIGACDGGETAPMGAAALALAQARARLNSEDDAVEESDADDDGAPG